ncbi:CLUMA_CG003075, isoform A [Clunio marinus]|uniref:CLUMA_CG003075, isoform A n=1 Tax=Clunio marinus TaxID=568069 RepID=A0A1J1HPJ9_9DIPT|nr:CLUMA_CG003075, isoform A [Clunio marinus]
MFVKILDNFTIRFRRCLLLLCALSGEKLMSHVPMMIIIAMISLIYSVFADFVYDTNNSEMNEALKIKFLSLHRLNLLRTRPPRQHEEHSKLLRIKLPTDSTF